MRVNVELSSTKNRSSYKNKQANIVVLILSCGINILHLALPIYSLQVFNRVLPSESLATLFLMTLLVTALAGCSMLLDGARSTIISRTALRADLAVFDWVTALMLKGDPSGQTQMAKAEELRTFRSSSLVAALFDAPWSVAFVLALFQLHPWLGLLTVVAISVLAVVGFLGPALSRGDRSEAADLSHNISVEFKTALAQREAMESMGARPRIQLLLVSLQRRLGVVTLKAMECQAWGDAWTRGLRSVSQIALLSVAALLVVTDELAVGAIVAASMLFARAVSPIERLGSCLHTILSFMRASRAVHASVLLHLKSTLPLALPPITGQMTIEGACMIASGRAKPILGPLSFDIKAGEVLSIVGLQGAGKSTLARILSGAQPPYSGKIRLDGAEIRQFDREQLGKQIGFLPESVQLGVGSIASIIARGQTPDAQDVIAASVLSGAHKIIQQLSEGYNTVIHGGEQHLSAGERQQIGLARAFYQRPALIILDEPTTHLDDRAENDIIEAIQTLKANGSTVVLISRLAALLNLTDRVLLLDHGKISHVMGKDKLKSHFAPKLATNSLEEALPEQTGEPVRLALSGQQGSKLVQAHVAPIAI